jgi:hypothetical protein
MLLRMTAKRVISNGAKRGCRRPTLPPRDTLQEQWRVTSNQSQATGKVQARTSGPRRLTNTGVTHYPKSVIGSFRREGKAIC